jgi:hypothetical protein
MHQQGGKRELFAHLTSARTHNRFPHYATRPLHLRLRVPEGHRIQRVTLNGRQYANVDPESETVIVPEGSKGTVEIHVQY